ncbi:thymidylate kinase-domain-containing protein [Neohortaea acidophila]|uniref:Thymidylate kinase n=1 Tax=Neohortaea acidophila TaxID=245834 RepID=A0A6A6PW55_9PEZI|nr:thymidylate kinase-domain-containing protein [Neohortaea acidophila]KAF2483527.1 thymidylate kinase-domain-containing protein [Neohortaea acidophila]
MGTQRGALVVFEGLDRSGKSTQCQRLVDVLRANGEEVHHMRFPNRSSPIGQMINSYLSGQAQQDDHAIHLLFSANRWESVRELEERINAGATVIVDRYYYSGCVYSAAKHIPSMDLEWCRSPDVGLPRPDVCIFLDISAEEQAKRGGFGEERYEKRELQDRVRECYHEMRKHPDEHADMVIVDAGRGMEEVEQEIAEVVRRVRKNVEGGESRLRTVQRW